MRMLPRPGPALSILASLIPLAAALCLAPPAASYEMKTPSAYAGADVCKMCHEAEWDQQNAHIHGRRLLQMEKEKRAWSCEGCHRPAEQHVKAPTETSVWTIVSPKQYTGAELAEMCLRCHQKTLRKYEWASSEHASAGIHCYQCHNHDIDSNKNHLFAQNSHHPVLLEERMACVDCHNPHKREKTDPDSIKRLCTGCHKEQRGPYLYEHGNISGGLTDACLDCHKPHGSPNAHLLRLTVGGLCLSCHADMLARPGHPPVADCTSCHKAYHGSNHDPFLFTP
jgi:predicted CXXCH cytochrome family protein